MKDQICSFTKDEFFSAEAGVEVGRKDRRLGGVSLVRLFSCIVRPITPTPTLPRQGGGGREGTLADRSRGIDALGILP